MASYTWGQIKLESIKKMFLNNDNIYEKDLRNMINDNKYKIYLNGMAQAANEGIAECVKRGRPFIKTFEFTQRPIGNVLGNNFTTNYYLGDEMTYESTDALAYYFEVDSKAIVDVYYIDEETGQWTLQENIENKGSLPGKFTAYKNYLTNVGIKLVFKGTTVYSYRNVALYNNNYQVKEGDISYIPDYKPYFIYDIDITKFKKCLTLSKQKLGIFG